MQRRGELRKAWLPYPSKNEILHCLNSFSFLLLYRTYNRSTGLGPLALSGFGPIGEHSNGDL